MAEKPTYKELEKRLRQFKQAESERRRIEKDYQTLFREMLDGFALHEIICDEMGKPVDYRFLAVNPSFERMTGLKSQDIEGMTVLQVLPGIEPHWIETYGRVALTGEPAFFENYSSELGKHFKVTAFQPAPQQFACIFIDITDRKRAEEERIRLNADLAAKNTELEQMVYVASHDLRSPLVNIDGYSKELAFAINDLRSALADLPAADKAPELSSILDREIPEALKFIRASTSKMDTLLTGLLRLSRLGRAALKIEPLDMNKLIAIVIESTEFQIKEAGFELDVGELPPCRSDAVQVNQVFSNLLDNSLKYAEPKRPGLIRISGNVEGDRAVYCIEDNGIGMASDHREKIFEIFHRLQPSLYKGEGLGLTIVKRILGRLEGNIRVESELGGGSRFYVALPIVEK